MEGVKRVIAHVGVAVLIVLAAWLLALGAATAVFGNEVYTELRLPPVPVWEHQLPVLAQAVACNLVKDHGVLFRLPMAVHFGDWQTVVYSCERGWES